MVFKINGVDIMPYIAAGGIKWTKNDVSGGNAVTMMDGTTYRDRITTKYNWEISCKPLTASQQKTILELIQPEYVTVQYTHPLTNTIKSGTYYSNNFPSTYLVRRADGTDYWGGLSFPLVQR